MCIRDRSEAADFGFGMKGAQVQNTQEGVDVLGQKTVEIPEWQVKEIKLSAREAKEEYERIEEEKRQAELEAQRQAELEAQRQAELEAQRQAEEEAARQAQEAYTNQAVQAASGELELLASIIFCEAGNQPYEGQVAVGAVIMNRVRSSAYPNSISEVIYQSGQFGPAMSGWLDSVLASGGYTDTAYQAAADALAGSNPIGDCLYFGCGDYGIQIGDHFFH